MPAAGADMNAYYDRRSLRFFYYNHRGRNVYFGDSADIVAHELGHATHKDIPRMLGMQIALFGVYAAIIGAILQSDALARAFGLAGVHFGFAFILFSILTSPLELLLGIPINYISRKAEYAADAFAVRLNGKAPARSAFKTLAQENLSNLNPHPLYVRFYYSHPPIPDRLSAIDAL